MLRCLSVLRKCVIGLLLLAFLLFPKVSVAQEQSASPPASSDPTIAARMLVVIEQKTICEQQLDTGGEGQEELKNKIAILDEKIQLLQDISNLKDEKIQTYENIIEMNKQMSEAKDKACADAVKAASPTWWENMSKYLVGIGIGGLLTGAAILLL